ncbi:MAG: hypothetical protein QM760_23425 [Nibricoccus sp.]
MNAFIARPQVSDARIFPAPRFVWENPSTIWSKLGAAATERAKGTPLGTAVRAYCGALAAEAEGREQRAEFYWREFDSHQHRLTRNPELLVEVMKKLAGEASADAGGEASAVAKQLIDELFIDAHAAAFNSITTTAGKASKADYHWREVKTLLSRGRMTPVQQLETVRAVVERNAGTAEAARRWDEMASVYREMLEISPDDFEALEGLVRALWQKAVGALSEGRGDSSAANEASMLQKILEELKKLAARPTAVPDVFEAVAHLSVTRAVRLANSGDVSEAMVMIEQALAVQEDLEPALEAKTQLTALMQQMTEQFNRLEAEIAMRPNATLNAQGLILKAQVRAGFKSAQKYTESSEAQALRENTAHARRRRLWLQIGYAPPSSDWNARAETLVTTLAMIAAINPSSVAELRAAWIEAAKNDPAIAELEPDPAVAFLAHRLFQEPWTPVSLQSFRPPAGEPLSIVRAATPAPDDAVPFKEWLRGAQNRGSVWRLGLAAAILMVAAILVYREAAILREHDRNVSLLTAAVREGNDLGAMDAAADFLGRRGFTADAREPDVIAAYQRALVRWMSNLEGEFDPQQQPVVDRYRRLIAHLNAP